MAYFARAAAAVYTPAPPLAPIASPPAPPRYPKRKRREVQYYDINDEENGTTDSEQECVLYKRPRISTKPRPKNKIFPFLSLPAEIRNQIYEECLPDLTEVPKDSGEEPGCWFTDTHKNYRRTIRYLPSVVDFPECWTIERHRIFGRYSRGTGGTQRGTGRGSGNHNNSNESDSEEEEDQERGPKALALGILAVCKQIYDEAAPMFYRHKLVFTTPEALFSFASKLSPSTAKLVRHIEIRTWGLTRSRKNRAYAAMTMLAAKGVTNLETLNINCSMGWFHSWRRSRNGTEQNVEIAKKVARKVYRDSYLWLEAIGAASGKWDMGVDVLKFSAENLERGATVPHDKYEDTVEGLMRVYRKELRRLLGMGAL